MDFPLPHPGPWLASQVAERLGSGRAAERLVQGGLLVRIAHGLYYRLDAWHALGAKERHLVTLRAHFDHHARLSEPGFVYSHLSAARLHGLSLWKPDEFIHVTVPRAPGRSRYRPEVRPHAGHLGSEDRCLVSGLPATALERTMVDSACILQRGAAQIIIDHGLRLGAEPARLEALLDRASGQRGVVTARAAIALGSTLSESPGESLLNWQLNSMPVPTPHQQIEVATRAGRVRVDTGWPAIRRGIEFDGRVKYFAYAPTPEVLLRERQREKALMEEDWRLLRLVWADLFDEAELRRRVDRLLAS
ncbi:hypothetical protein [Sinomonas mesophila]|uniref:hypothetical protein n=1 Tax=Sinomonas mesophila TaxID=1531955 RepID=UPI00098750D7|nr:hypothetical protein [Sinomonas mesophila]